MTKVAVWASWVAIIWYGGSLLLIALGFSDPAVGLIDVIAWLLAMPFALLVAVVAGLALASDGRAALKAAALGFPVFAAGVGISIALLAAVPNQNPIGRCGEGEADPSCAVARARLPPV